MKAVFDTNILIDYLCGRPEAAATLAAYTEKLISRITWMEVLVGVKAASEEPLARQFLGSFRVIELSPVLAESAVALRRTAAPRLKLPDAIIYATAKAEACPLVTRNTRDFGAAASDVVEPYRLTP